MDIEKRWWFVKLETGGKIISEIKEYKVFAETADMAVQIAKSCWYGAKLLEVKPIEEV